MMTTSSADALRERVQSLLAGTKLAPLVTSVSIQSPDGFTDDDVLRITITLRSHRGVDVDATIDVMRSIEDALSDMDDRFPSIYFAEAA